MNPNTRRKLSSASLPLRVLATSGWAAVFVLVYDVPLVIAILASLGVHVVVDAFIDTDLRHMVEAVQEGWRTRIRGALAEVQVKMTWWPRHWELGLWRRINGTTRRTAFGPFKLNVSWGDPNDLAGFHAERDGWESLHRVPSSISGLRWSTVQVTFYRGLPTYSRGTADQWFRINGRALRIRNAWWRGIEVALHAQ